MRGHNSGPIPIGFVIFFFILASFVPFVILGFPLQQSFTGLVALTLFLIAFLNTDIALIIVIMSMLLSPEIRAGSIGYRNINIRAEDLFIFVIFFAWMAKMAVKKELGLMRKNPLNGTILAYITVCIVSSLIAVIAGRIMFKSSFFYLLKYCEYFLIFFMVGNNLRTVSQAKTFVFFMLLTCFIVCCFAWAQIHLGGRVSAPFESEGGEPNTFAGYLLFMMSIIMGLFLHSASRKQKAILLGLLGFCAVPFVLTLSREGWISFVPMFAAFIMFYKRARLILLAVLIIAIMVVPKIMPKQVQDRVKDTFATERSYKLLGTKFTVSESTAARIDTWREALQMLFKRPFLGWGIPVTNVIDNQYTRTLIETGLIGFSLFVWMICLLFKQSFVAFRAAHDPFVRGITLGFICGLVGLLTQSFAAAVFILIRIMEPFWFLAAIVLSLPEAAAENYDD